jgi:hypothetical protein
MEEHLYIVRTGRATKLWFVLYGKRPVSPRIKQIAKTVKCFFFGHGWSRWSTDDMEGPSEQIGCDEDGPVLMPLLSRECRENEKGIRVCHSCGLVQRRWPVERLDPDTFWPQGKLTVMED